MPKKQKQKNYSLFQVTWNDAAARGQWKSLDDTIFNEGIEIVSVGYKISENRKNVTLAQSLSKGRGYADTITIPRGCVVSTKKLSGYNVNYQV